VFEIAHKDWTMKFALVNGVKTEAQQGQRGSCEICQSVMIAKCGNERMKHWAHKSKISCDPWWENETEWHRAWKNRFPENCQEIIHRDPATGEIHKADIKTTSGLVIEFQRSAIQPAEMRSRECFYKNMVWVVDGTRLMRDYPRFLKGFSALRRTVKDFFLSSFPDECFPSNWLTSSVPVYFDFQGSHDTVQPQDARRSALWCLFPNRVEGYAVVAGVPCEELVKLSSTAPDLLFAHRNLSYIAEYIRLQRESAAAHTGRQYPDPLSLLNARRFRRHRL
jgi:hypothetical protein